VVVLGGETVKVFDKVLPVPTEVPPHEPVYQLSVVPLPPFAVRIVEFPRQIEYADAVTEPGATGVV
jgi:hypothetical protein